MLVGVNIEMSSRDALFVTRVTVCASRDHVVGDLPR
jgi:hypothetical protein